MCPQLVEQAVEYALRIGFPPHRDYKAACRVFGGISRADCSESFPFGKDGKPFYISGPNEDDATSMRTIHTLERRCGEGNFDYIASMSPPEESEEEVEVRTREQMNIRREADYIIEMAQARESHIVTVGSLVLFSTETGDAWMLDPDDFHALCLARDGIEQPVTIRETADSCRIGWTANTASKATRFMSRQRRVSRARFSAIPRKRSCKRSSVLAN